MPDSGLRNFDAAAASVARSSRAFGRGLLRGIRAVDYINTHARVARIRWLLENTAMPVLEIALSMGLPDDKHLARFFRRLQGVTPVEWRKRQRR